MVPKTTGAKFVAAVEANGDTAKRAMTSDSVKINKRKFSLFLLFSTQSLIVKFVRLNTNPQHLGLLEKSFGFASCMNTLT